MSGERVLRAVEDSRLRARVLACHPLLYSDGPDPQTDRPAHVRAASGIDWLGGRLAIVQDDANFLALVDPATMRVGVRALPAGSGGARQFDDLRGTKHLKLDLECAVTVRLEGRETLLAFGSGSTPLRTRVLLFDLERGPRLVDATPLYLLLAQRPAFAGSELNVEGAVVQGEVLRLFNRGNGAPRPGVPAVDATADLPLDGLLRFLDSGAPEPPIPHSVVGYELGTIDGIRLTYTDACAQEERIVYTAAAEDSPDAVRDGDVAGSAIGLLDGHGPRYALLRDAGGRLFRGKVEGITPVRERPGEFWITVDEDDPERPSLLCRIALEEG